MQQMLELQLGYVSGTSPGVCFWTEAAPVLWLVAPGEEECLGWANAGVWLARGKG